MEDSKIDEIIYKHVGKFLDRHGLRWEGDRGKCGSAVFEVLLVELADKIVKEVGVASCCDTREEDISE